jgi:Late exocytosis, associated with Golgi transport
MLHARKQGTHQLAHCLLACMRNMFPLRELSSAMQLLCRNLSGTDQYHRFQLSLEGGEGLHITTGALCNTTRIFQCHFALLGCLCSWVSHAIAAPQAHMLAHAATEASGFQASRRTSIRMLGTSTLLVRSGPGFRVQTHLHGVRWQMGLPACRAWLRPVLCVRTEDIYLSAGLDAVVLLKTIEYGVQLFTPMALICLAVCAFLIASPGYL